MKIHVCKKNCISFTGRFYQLHSAFVSIIVQFVGRKKVNKEGKLQKMKLNSLKRRVSFVLAICFLISCTSPLGTIVNLQAQETVNEFYDFRDGSIIPTDTDGKSDVVSGNLTVKAGKQNTYQYNGTTHGVLFKAGNSIEVTVPGSVTVTVGDCLYSAVDSLTLTDAEGNYSQTVEAGAGNYNNGSVVEFQYEGDATVLTLAIEDKTYIPCIKVSNTGDVVEEPEDVLANPDTTITEWLFDGSDSDASTVSFQKNSGFYKNLYVDATSSKFVGRASDVQINAGTIVYIPVEAGKKVQVKMQSDAFTVNGAIPTATDVNSVYEYQYTGTAATYVALEVSANTYLYAIQVTDAEVILPDTGELQPPVTDITTWYFDGVHETSFKGNVQKKAEYVNNLYVDAAEGKFTARITENGYSSDQGDTQAAQGTKVYIPVASKSTIYVVTNSVADMSVNGTMLAKTGTVATTAALSDLETTGNVYTYENSSRAEGYVCLEFVGAGYLKALHVEYANYEVPSVSSKTDVWDFSGVADDSELCNSYITKEAYSQLDSTVFTKLEGTSNYVFADAAGGTSNTVGSVSFGDLTLNYRYKDRLYSANSAYSYDSKLNSYTALTYADGYQAAGGYFANGTSSEKHRNITIANVEAGDIITIYMTSSRAASTDYPNPTDTLHFVYSGSEGTQDDTDTLTNVAGIYAFTAQYSGTYKVYAEAANGTKPVISRVTRQHTVGVISGQLDMSQVENFNDDNYGLVFMDAKGSKYDAVLSNDGLSYYVTAPVDGTYTAILTDAKGFEISEATRTVDGGLNVTHDFIVSAVDMFEISGTVAGFAADYNVTDFGIVLEAENYKEAVILDVDTKNMTFTGLVENAVNYTITLTGVNDYMVASETAVRVTEAAVLDIAVATAPVYAAAGNFTNITDTSIVSDLKFTNTADGYVYTAQVTETGYTAVLRNGVYQASATVAGYTMDTIVTVNGQDVTRDLLFIQDALAAGSVEWAADIYVGYESIDSVHNYVTINDALEVAAAMNPTSEAQRITIHIAPGTYREQIIVQTPYVSFVNDSKEEVLVTWYYGIGYEYFSANENGFYSESAEYNQNAKNIATKWGCSVYLQASAKAFRASGIVFENSFNRYITEEELADGVTLSARADSSIKVERTRALDVQSREATERAAAMVIEADQTEFVNCEFLSSQDTLYTAPKLTGYFLNSKIEGGVDYIFGYGDYVFDSCELSFYGYSNKKAAGYITACRTPKTEGLGYLFNNCTVTGNPELTVAPGYFGRPWGADATVTFLNTTLESDNLIQPVGWYSMSGVQPEAANYGEYGTVLADGTAVDTSSRTSNTVLSSEDAAKIKVTDYFGDWTPFYYG